MSNVVVDDWRLETQGRLSKSEIYKVLKGKCDSDPAGFKVLELVDEAVFYSYQRTKVILRHMGEFTLHDADHLFRVLILMERLIALDQIHKLTVPELMLLILCSFFHDIGMAPEEKDVLAWKKIWDANAEFDDDNEEKEYGNFKRHCFSRPDQMGKIESYIQTGNYSEADLVKSYLVADYIRNTHADRARAIIGQDWLDKIRYRDTDLTVELASICFSHNESAYSLLELDSSMLCGPGVRANLQLIAVILRLSDLLDFDGKRTPSILYSHLFVRHPISIREWEKHRAIEAWEIDNTRIQYHAKCDHPAIEASIHAFCDIIDNELVACNSVVSAINNCNKIENRDLFLSLPFKVNREKIGTKMDVYGNPRYIYRETQFSLSKDQVVDLLMGTKLYGDPEVALRELLQNSIDACLLRAALEREWGNEYVPEVHVKYYSEGDESILEVSDNGVGMDQYIIDTYYTKIGSSFYKSPDFFDLRSKTRSNFIPTSRFGIGVLSCFMVTDALIVDTRRVYGPHNSSDPVNLTIEGQDSIFWIRPGSRRIPGTSTKLHLRKQRNPWRKMTDIDFIQSVENVATNPPFAITIESESTKRVRDQRSFGRVSARSLMNHSWDQHENVRVIEIALGKSNNGIAGSVIVAVLESHGMPVADLEKRSREVCIDGQTYNLDMSMSMGGSDINMSTTSIAIDEDGKIEESTTYKTHCKSVSRLSLHGIDVPTSLFPDAWRTRGGQARLDWPFPAIVVVDVHGSMDLDLNSSRTQIIISDKWVKFEEVLSFDVCLDIYSRVGPEYWNKLEAVLEDSMIKNDIFIGSMKKVSAMMA